MSFAAFALAFFCQQETIRQDVTICIDERGDATMEVQFQLSAKQWLNWKNNFGDHPDLLKRDLIHRYSMLELADYRLDVDAMNRKATASVKARGAARYRGDGKYEMELPGEWNKVSSVGNEWAFSHSQLIGQGVMLNETNKIVLPARATGTKLGAVVDGQQKLVYTAGPSRPFSPWPVFAGAGLAGMLLATVLRFALGGAPASPGAPTIKMSK